MEEFRQLTHEITKNEPTEDRLHISSDKTPNVQINNAPNSIVRVSNPDLHVPSVVINNGESSVIEAAQTTEEIQEKPAE
ncbi:unnamed protein product [Vitrella brassicaformis CCMP3155]|uniref:Uncharacterized protein n=1 Tax=Vitrella brassicaformis (strain CCMP3155) TaxID=1169540 RepID=A0A0G4GZ87_VITBC|nr:unnamed protein product [Vitrella brassicaformis CCMP3155]|eukprot:CEM36570.1 unnamed protein product [Vitrella brassicaformis CCMP3155]